MNREEAEKIVKPYIINVGGYGVVTLETARKILGQERLEQLLDDQIRKHGPSIAAPETIYFWNVVDWLILPPPEDKDN